ncbi:hypothetical protein C5167_016296 [Papaver somniferum]|nr:hypothetical protein C5167_016296 [Papaver somniferum]
MDIMNSEFGNDNDFIKAAMEQPVITIDDTPKKTPKRTAKRPASKEKSVRRSPEKILRRSPRLQAQSKKENSNGRASRKLFVGLLNEVESQGYSCLSQASVGSSSVPIQVTDTFNRDYWVDAVNKNDAWDNNDEEEENVTYKVGYERTDSSSSEEDNEKVSNDGGSNDINDGPEAIDDKDAKPKFDYQKWKEDFNMHSDEEEQHLFPVEEEVSLVYPTKIEYKTYKSDKKRLRVRYMLREEYGCN